MAICWVMVLPRAEVVGGVMGYGGQIGKGACERGMWRGGTGMGTLISPGNEDRRSGVLQARRGAGTE